MGLHPRFYPPQRFSRRRILFIVLAIYGCIKVFISPHLAAFRQSYSAFIAPLHKAALPPPPPILPLTASTDDAMPASQIYHFSGTRIWGNGTYIDLGDRRTHLPFSLLSRFFPAPQILPSCLTQAPPAQQAAIQPLPVHDDWPGFYGAPWTARAGGNLLVLLDVYAPRKIPSPLPAPQFQFYPNYTGQPDPALSIRAPASFVRGSKAVLYRVFINANPFRCLDLVVQNGENNGTGHLYYQKYHHYYESTASFTIQQ